MPSTADLARRCDKQVNWSFINQHQPLGSAMTGLLAEIAAAVVLQGPGPSGGQRFPVTGAAKSGGEAAWPRNLEPSTAAARVSDLLQGAAIVGDAAYTDAVRIGQALDGKARQESARKCLKGLKSRCLVLNSAQS
jgi:hypothetical protein